MSAMQRQEKLALLMPAFDDELKALAEEISETRFRLGIPDTDVFGGSGFTMRKMQLQLRQGLSTVQEGIDFFTLGLRMLGSDIGYSSSLFGRASLGNTLKPREVSVRAQCGCMPSGVARVCCYSVKWDAVNGMQALRRTLKDIFTFVPFAIILIIPLTPLGHVLIFGFIQRYFPDLFPSQFNARRQGMVKRYEQLREQLVKAQAAADHAEVCGLLLCWPPCTFPSECCTLWHQPFTEDRFMSKERPESSDAFERLTGGHSCERQMVACATI